MRATTSTCAVEISAVFRVDQHAWYIARAKDTILLRARQHAGELGVAFGGARIVDTRYRWGSCFVFDYVIVHELAHLIEPNHTARFWSIVRARAPTMEKAKAWLREHGQVLEEEV